ncbi:alpha/beta fold hydrolase [Pontibacter sp. JAM-7]|uniref:alpha/beta fold hydrolase n=1 Tax=Pontibacter sp. JAM-7 TaxID=3366581 RepID=UPI003AF50C1B
MTVQIRQPVISHEHLPSRMELRKKLKLDPYLEQRQAFNVGASAVHCELYEYGADAPLVLFLPGMGTYSELYAELLYKLSREGFNVVAIDPPGHGYSGGDRGHYTVEQMSHAVSAVLDVLQQRYNGAVMVYGYSIGALLAVALAERDPRVQAVLCHTLLLPDRAPDLMHRMGWNWLWGSALWFPTYKVPLKSFLDFERLLGDHPAVDELLKDPLMVYDYPLQTLASLFNYRCKIVRQEMPFDLLVMHGDRDEVLPLSYSQALQSFCKHPVQVAELKRQGHITPWLWPERMVRRAARWLHETAEKHS